MLHLPIKSEDELMQYKNTQIVDEASICWRSYQTIVDQKLVK